MAKKKSTEPEIIEEKPRNIFDVFNSISKSKKLENGDMELYTPYLMNRIFSKHPDTLFIANELNVYTELSNEMQCDLYLYAIIPKTRFAKWFKPEPSAEELNYIQTSLEVSKKKSKEYLDLLDDLDKSSLKLSKGGITSGSKSKIKKYK